MEEYLSFKDFLLYRFMKLKDRDDMNYCNNLKCLLFYIITSLKRCPGMAHESV